MQWTNQSTARLTVKQSGTSNTFSFEGVNATTGTPEQFIAATNRLLDIVQLTATTEGMTRSIKQEVTDNG